VHRGGRAFVEEEAVDGLGEFFPRVAVEGEEDAVAREDEVEGALLLRELRGQRSVPRKHLRGDPAAHAQPSASCGHVGGRSRGENLSPGKAAARLVSRSGISSGCSVRSTLAPMRRQHIPGMPVPHPSSITFALVAG